MAEPKGFDSAAFFAAIDKRRETNGARVVYYDNVALSVLRIGPPVCQSGLLAVVIRKGGKQLIPTSSEIAEARDKKFNAELLNLGLSCGGALLAWAVTATATGAAPVTGGTSLIIAKLSGVAGAAGTAQCINAGVRMASETFYPAINEWLDGQDWYNATMLAMDGLSLVSAVATGAGTIRMVQMARSSTGKSLLTILKGLSRHERKRLTEEIIRVRNPGISGHELKVFVSRRLYPKRYANTEIQRGVASALLDATNAALGIVGSAVGGLVGQAVSSEPREDLLVGVVNAYETM